MRQSLWIIALVFAAIITPTVLSAANITYTVNQTVGIGSMTGTITTDGAIGTLATADTVDWNLKISDGTTTLLLTPTDSLRFDVGSALSASAIALMFNFSTGGPQNSFYGFFPNGGGMAEWVGNVPPSGNGNFQIFNLNGDSVSLQSAVVSGNQVIASIPAVPEPGTNSLMLIGIGLVFVMRKRISQGLQQAA